MTSSVCYISQTVRCVNVRLNKHKMYVKIGASNSEIARHVAEYGNCAPEWYASNILEFERDEKKTNFRAIAYYPFWQFHYIFFSDIHRGRKTFFRLLTMNGIFSFIRFFVFLTTMFLFNFGGLRVVEM